MSSHLPFAIQALWVFLAAIYGGFFADGLSVIGLAVSLATNLTTAAFCLCSGQVAWWGW